MSLGQREAIRERLGLAVSFFGYAMRNLCEPPWAIPSRMTDARAHAVGVTVRLLAKADEIATVAGATD